MAAISTRHDKTKRLRAACNLIGRDDLRALALMAAFTFVIYNVIAACEDKCVFHIESPKTDFL